MNEYTNKTEMTEVNDPLIGTQQDTDSVPEAVGSPDDEVALKREPIGQAEKSRRIAGALGIFFGWLGLHRFYLGFNEIGGFQLGLSATAAAVVFIAAYFLSAQLDMFSATLTALGVVSLVWVWGFFEGCAILIGELKYDAQRHPLR